jgi:hypothetical protein
VEPSDLSRRKFTPAVKNKVDLYGRNASLLQTDIEKHDSLPRKSPSDASSEGDSKADRKMTGNPACLFNYHQYQG